MNNKCRRFIANLLTMLLLAWLFAAISTSGYSQTVDAFNPDANASVTSMAVQADGKILVVGNFTNLCNQPRNGIGRLFQDGTLDLTFNPGSSAHGQGIYSLAIQPDGKILLGGSFISVGSHSCSNIVRLNIDGSLDESFNSAISNPVSSLTLQPDGKILVNCDSFISRLNSDGRLDNSFASPVADGLMNSFITMALQPDGKIIVGGCFGSINGEIGASLGRLNSDGSLDRAFNPNVGSSFVVFGIVKAIALQPDGKLIIGGYFDRVGGETCCLNVCRLNSDGSLDSNFYLPYGADGESVSTIAIQTDGEILLSGDLSTLGGYYRTIGRLNSAGGLDLSFYTQVNGAISSLAIQGDGSIIAGGNFTTLGGLSRNHIGRITNTSAPTTNLTFDGSTITWMRGGTSPEVWLTSFEVSTNHINWISLGSGQRISGGWQVTGLNYPTNATVRARGIVSGGDGNSSSWYIETIAGPPMACPPAITSQPLGCTNKEGATATFSVTASGTSPLSYHWHKNGVVLTNGLRMATVTNASLTISNLQISDTGNYTVLVTNQYGSIISSNAVLTVVVPDTNRPVLTITSPTMNQRWSNAVFTVKGTAHDNVQVSHVWCQLNDSGWQPAVTANNWTNWTATVSLLTGTNVVQAYSVDTAGNTSTNASVNLIYVATAGLSVASVGSGTLTPNYSNAVLELGKSYTTTAKPATGYAFSNWAEQVDGALTFSTTNAALTFVMQSNLTITATFVDAAKPVLTITTPTANQRWSNAVFTVAGKTTDNGPIATVNYQLNGGDWTNAQTANGWSNWTARVTLIPGTNTIRAFALDAAGNPSLTNAQKLVYVLSDRLQVATVGQGTLTPNYSNALLEIGRSYTVTAKPATGYAFTNWTEQVNGTLTFGTNKAALIFMMQSNLSLTATLVDVQKPVLTITSPKAKQKWSNEAFTVIGTVKDNGPLAAVNYQLNGGVWTNAQTANGWSNWTASVTLVPGTNWIRAYAVDAAGNRSLTNTVNLNFVVAGKQFVVANTTKVELGGRVAYDGTNYLVAILGNGSAASNITAQLMSPTGNPIGSRIVTGRTAAAPGGLPFVAYGGDTYLMVWEDNATGADLTYGQLIDRAGELLGAAFPVSSHGSVKQTLAPPGVAYGSEKFLVVWNDDRNGTFNIYGRLVSPDGSLGSEFALAPGLAKQMEPAVAFDGNNYLVVWEHQTSTGPEQWDVYGAFVSPAGAVGSVFQINQTSSPSYNPLSVAFDGNHYLVVWNRDIGAGYPSQAVWDIYARFVTPDGATPGDEFAVTTAAGGQIMPQLAFGQGNYLILWSDKLTDNKGNYTVTGRFFSDSGQPIGGEFAPFSVVGSNRPMLAGVIHDGTRFMAVGTLGVLNATSHQFTSGDVYGTFIGGITPRLAVKNVALTQPTPMSVQAMPDPPLQFAVGNGGLSVVNGVLQMQFSGPDGEVVVEACTNLVNPAWQPVQTNAITGGSSSFSDSQWTNYPGRFYRLRSP